MTERPPHAIAGEYDNRDEYHTDARGLAAEIDASLEAIDDVLLAENTNECGEVRHGGDSYGWVTELNLLDIETEVEEPVIFFDGNDVLIKQLEKRSLLYDATIHVESYNRMRKDKLNQISEVLVKQSVEGYRDKFIAKYTIEQFYGGSIQAYVQRTDVLNSQELETREMLPYDLHELQRQLATIAMIRERVLVPDDAAEEDYGTRL